MTTSSPYTISDGREFFSLFYVGINIENVLYGIELILYFKTVHVLLSNRKARKGSNLFYVLFSSMMVFSITVWVATQAFFGQKLWLIDSDFPGGPNAYWRKHVADWYIDWGTTAIVVLQLMTDGLMIYRCRIIWDSCCVVVVPIFLWLATFVLGVSVDWTTSSPGGDYFTGVSIRLSLAYWSVSVFLSMASTCMICYRVLRHGWMVQQHLGHEYASEYISIATIVVESVLPYTLSGIAVLVSLGVGSSTSVLFVSVYFMMMCISPQMLVLRVMEGKAWDNSTFSRSGSTIKFSPGSVDTFGSHWSDSNGATIHLQALPSVLLSDRHDKLEYPNCS